MKADETHLSKGETMIDVRRYGTKRTIIMIILFLILVPGGIYIFQDYEYMGSGIATLVWGLLCFWYYSKKDSNKSEADGTEEKS